MTSYTRKLSPGERSSRLLRLRAQYEADIKLTPRAQRAAARGGDFSYWINQLQYVYRPECINLASILKEAGECLPVRDLIKLTAILEDEIKMLSNFIDRSSKCATPQF